jgi:ATP-dependent DNA ligase
VRLITRKGNDFTRRFPLIGMAVAALPLRSCVIDGEAIVCDDSGLAVFDLIRSYRTSGTAVHCAFDLLEIDGEAGEATEGRAVRYRAQRALRRRRRDHLQPRLQARVRGHRIEADRVAVHLGPVAALGQGEEPEGPCGDARGGGGLG